MRSIDADILAELAKVKYTEFRGVKLTISATDYLYTDADVPMVVNAERFEPRGFKISNLSYSQANIVTRASIEMENLDDVFSSLFVGSTVQGSTVEIHSIIYFDSDPPDSTIVFEGTIDDWSLDEERVTITIASVLQRWSQRTINNYGPSCRWKVFKGTECGYTGGATTCDRSYQRCVDLGNQDNFGGFRWLPSIQDKPIWWGQKPAI